MKTNYLHYTFFSAMLLFSFCIPNQLMGNEKYDTNSSSLSTSQTTSRLSFLTNSISFMSSAVHTDKVGFMAEADSFKSLDEDFGCYVEMPTLHLDGTCVQANSTPNSYGDEVEFMWLERRNDQFIPLTDWSTDTALDYCPDTPGYYRMCARTVGCTDIYESTEIHVPNVACGSLDGIYIYDQQNDQAVLGPITNGQHITTDELPDNYYLVAETNGHVGSVSIAVNNHQITENVSPFTYPSGGETGNNWNAGVGEYTIHAGAFRNNNAAGANCDTIDLSFEIIQNCEITVHAGDDIDTCSSDDITLTATTTNENTCEGGCVYPIIESDRCSGGNPSEIWMSNSGNNFFNTTIHSNFEILADGTAVYNSKVANGSDTLDVHITFTGRTTTPPTGSPKLGCDTNDTSDYVYWTTTTGTIVSQNHGTFQLSRMGEAFQLGIGGDVTRTGFGASGWFHVTGGDGFYTRGDVNIKLGECVPNSASNPVDYVWTTVDGNIIGDANQQSITVNQSGTYQVKAKDCADCEAIDEIIVTITDAPEVQANNLTESVTISQGESFPEVTFTNGEVISYSENDSDSLCEIELSSHENFNTKNLWFHSFPEQYNKNFLWKDGYVLVKEDGTAEIFGTITNVDLPDSGFHLHYYFEALKDFDTWIAGGGYQNTDNDASERLYARVDFNKPNSIVGFGAFSDSDLRLISNGNVAHMDYGPRDVYGGFGVGFWIDYEGTVNGMPAGNSMSTSGANHNDMYSAIGDCVELPDATCSDLIVRHWVVEDACGVRTTYVQAVTVNNDVEANAGDDVTISSGASTTLTATGGGTYVWSTGETTPSITVTPNETTTYSVMVTSDNGECTDADAVIVSVDCSLEVNLGEDVSFCSETETILTASINNTTNTPRIISSYNVTDADTSQGICANVHGNEQGVILQKGNPNFPVTGNYNAWKVHNELILNEYDNDTANITGTVIDEQGKIGTVDMLLFDKQNNGKSWSADCYLDNLVGPQLFYQSFYGTITVDGVSYTVEPKVSKHHFVFAEGASLESGQFGFGAWTSGTFGNGGEWFGNLEPREFTNCDEVTYLWSTGETTESITVSPESTTTYTVTVQNCDNCEATDEVVIELGPALTVNAGEDVEVCQEETVELSALVENAKECAGGCEYPIIEEDRCAGGDPAEIWMMNDAQNMFNTTIHSSFKVFDDGTATYVSRVSNGTDILDINILFTGRTTIAPVGSPKLGCDTGDTSGFVYYTNTSGTVISQNHGTFEVSRMGEAFQLGIGGDVARTGFGASGWFYLNGGDGFYDHGDVNIKLGECVTFAPNNAVDYVWTTEDGNIVGDADQESITVDQSGTYKIVAKDCKNCEAEDEVTVTITNPQAGEMTADADMVCLENNTVTISATSNGNQNIPADYVQAYVLTAGDDLVIQDLNTSPQFEVSQAGKYTIHSFVYPTSFDPLSVVNVGTTTGGDVNALLVQGGGSLCASLDVAGAMIRVNDKLVLGDFVWLDENQNGLQDTGEIGVNGITATLFQNDGTEIESTTTTNNAITGAPGAYKFEVCPNSGEYYIVFTGIPNGFEITSQNAGNDELDSDSNENGRTDSFTVLDESILTIDAGIFSPCVISPEITAIDSICDGEEVLLTASGGDSFQWKENGVAIEGATTATLSVSPSSTTTYSVVVTDTAQFDCSGEVSKEIIVYELPTADAGEDVAICIGDEVTLTATGGDSYLWSSGETSATITVSPQATHEYSVSVTSAQGCEAIDTVIVTVNELPTADAGEDVAICIGDEVTLMATGGDSYLWSTGETSATITVSPQATQEYSVTVTSAQGCEAIDTVIVTVNELPTADAGEDVAICIGDEVTLTATGGDSYLWSTGETSATITVSPQATHEYSVSVTSAQGCEDTDTVIVTVNELPTADAGEDVAICIGDEVTLTATGGDSYLWSTGETSATITVSPQATQEYSVTVTSAQGCEDTDTVIVTVNELPTADAGEDVAICIGDEVTLTATGGDSYLWSTGETTATIEVSPEITTEYGVIVTSAAGCEATDEVIVTVNQKVTIGDFVFEDKDNDGIQDGEDFGINGITVKLFQCDPFYGNAHGDLVDTCITSNNPITGEAGYYNFDVCIDSGSYYMIFEDIPTGYKFTTQEMAAVDLDSDVNRDGVTACFDVTDTDNTTIDAGLVAETCGMGIGSKVLPRDPGGVYTARNSDTACIGDDFYLWLFLDEENLGNFSGYQGDDLQGWSFTYEFPNGKVFTQANAADQSYRTQEYTLTEEDFGTYKISWTSPDGCHGLTYFDLTKAPECLPSGQRPTFTPMIAMVYPVPALASTDLSIVINTANKSLDSNTNTDIVAYGLQAFLPIEKETVTTVLFDTNGKNVGPTRTYEVDKGRTLVTYPLGNLATGSYILLVSGKDWTDSKQIIVE
ncbi:SdrD B-like domain-containing protein [Maribacter chungangensis]|uniref:SdrD B-like domain-containing protein n=1 Tax=Maribacter chungangensis TaxID=1069117 RepID=A0ABW3B1U8_9FLAO